MYLFYLTLKTGNLFIRHFKLFYLEALIPVLFIFNIKSALIRIIRSVMVCLSAAVLCFVLILNSISAPMVHNYTRYNYTESLKNSEDNGAGILS